MRFCCHQAFKLAPKSGGSQEVVLGLQSGIPACGRYKLERASQGSQVSQSQNIGPSEERQNLILT